MCRPRARYALEVLERRDCPATVGVIATASALPEAGGIGTFAVRLAAPDSRPVSVGYFIGGDATRARDYQLTLNGKTLAGPTGTLSFQPNETVKTITVVALDDTLREGNERVTFTLMPLQNATIGQATATVTIADNDSYTAWLNGVARVQPGRTSTFSFRLSSPATQPETFYVSTVAGSANAIDDFRPLTRMPVTFNPGDTVKSFGISVLANSPSETDEVFVIRAEPVSVGFPSISPFTVTIAGNGGAPLPVISVASSSVNEGNSGTTACSFTVRLSAPAAAPVTVSYVTADGTATDADQDYTPVVSPQTLTFAAGETVKTVEITVKGDTKPEADETFSLILSDPTGGTLGTAAAVGTIRNDDGVPPPAQGTWTIFVYMTGENLNTFARDDINEMERFLSTLPAGSGVNIVVSWDQPASGTGTAYATGNGAQPAWRTYGRSVLKPDSTATIASTFDLSFGEKNTGDPATLVDFIKWGVQQSPASNYALQLWGHGGGLDGSQFDSESGSDPLTINEISQALGTAGVPPLSLVSYDNCLMGMAEVGYAVAQRFNGHFVASEELVNGAGQNYVTAYSALTANPAGKTSADLGAAMVASYQIQYAGDPSGCDTFSAVATGGYTQLASTLSQFVTATDTLTAADRTTLTTLVNLAPSLSFEEPSFRDLGRFMARVVAAGTMPAPVRTAATSVVAAVANMVSAKTTDGRNSSGIAIYLPTSTDTYLASYTTTAAAFCNATGWDRFARWLATGTRAAAAGGGTAAATTPRHFVRHGFRGFGTDAPAAFSAVQWAAFTTDTGQPADGRSRGRQVTVPRHAG